MSPGRKTRGGVSFQVIEGGRPRVPMVQRDATPPMGAWLIAGVVCWSLIGVAAWAYIAARTMGVVR